MDSNHLLLYFKIKQKANTQIANYLTSDQMEWIPLIEDGIVLYQVLMLQLTGYGYNK